MLSSCKHGLDREEREREGEQSIEWVTQAKWYYMITYTNLSGLLVISGEVEVSR